MVSKTIYILLIILYICGGIIYGFKYEISYRIEKVPVEEMKKPLMERRTFTYEEFQALEKSYYVRKNISNGFAVFSFLVAVVSSIFLYYGSFKPKIIPKLIVIISICFCVIHILGSSVSFIGVGIR